MDGGGVGVGIPPQSSRLRFMCSYGGQIVPRTHDKSLCYIGGDTRIVAVDRKDKISISELNHRLSKTLNPQNQQFILKYQLPNEDLDSLISVSTDEDLENMVDEYDRLLSSKSSSGGKGRLRLFLFPKSAPNSIEGGFSESSLLGLDDDFVGQNNDSESSGGGGGGGVNQDVHSVPNSPMLNNTTSSFGSTSSPKVGIEEQFQHMGVSFPVVRKAEEQGNLIFSDDERSDHGGYRLVQQIQPQVQLQYQQYQQKQTTGGAFDVPSPDSFSSDGSVTNPLSRQRQARYQESSYIQLQSKTMDQNTNNSKIQMQQQNQNQESEYVLSNQYDQNQPQFHQPQQFVHAGGQYIQSGAVPMQSYYHMYPQQQVLDQQYPVYYVPARQTQTQPYNMPSYTESTQNAPLSRPQMPPPASYNQSRTGPPTPASQQFVPIPLGQHQAQYVNYPQFQSMVPSSVPQMHYTQPMQQQPQLGSQFQTQLASTMVLPDSPVKIIKQQQP